MTDADAEMIALERAERVLALARTHLFGANDADFQRDVLDCIDANSNELMIANLAISVGQLRSLAKEAQAAHAEAERLRGALISARTRLEACSFSLEQFADEPVETRTAMTETECLLLAAHKEALAGIRDCEAALAQEQRDD